LGGGAYIISKNQKETNKQTAIVRNSNEIPVNIVTASFEHVSKITLLMVLLAPLQNMQLSSEIAEK
jgi:hypothetical protein